jgi:hypothetical protein
MIISSQTLNRMTNTTHLGGDLLLLSKKTKLFVTLVSVILLTVIIGCVRAGTETFTVSPLQEVVRTAGLSEGDKVSGSITVSGGTGNDIDFYVTDFNGNTIRRYDRATQTSFSFTASTTGTYTMHFDNKFSIFSSKSVTLDYTVSEAILGLAPEVFLLLVFIIVIVVLSIVVFALKRRKTATPTQ